MHDVAAGYHLNRNVVTRRILAIDKARKRCILAKWIDYYLVIIARHRIEWCACCCWVLTAGKHIAIVSLTNPWTTMVDWSNLSNAYSETLANSESWANDAAVRLWLITTRIMADRLQPSIRSITPLDYFVGTKLSTRLMTPLAVFCYDPSHTYIRQQST